MMSNIDLSSCCLLFCCSSILLTIILSLPIVEIVFGIQYYNQIECISDINIPLDIWLIVRGSSTILTLILFICVMYFISRNNLTSFLGILLSPLFYVLQFFNFIWLILGSIIFWRYCSNVEPESVNILLYVSLIFGYISILVSILNGNNNKSSTSSTNRFNIDV